MGKLDVILQHQLSTDEQAVASVLTVITQLTPSHLNSPQLLLARIHSLLQKPAYPGARWAGLCLAYRVASIRSEIMVENAKSWISSTLPLLSRDEPPSILIEATRLLHFIFTSVADMPEFHRQVVTPNIQKYSLALVLLAEKPNAPRRVMVFTFQTLTHMIFSFPTAHFALMPRIYKLALSYLSPSDGLGNHSGLPLSSASAALLSVLHLAGGKVRSVLLWRKTLEDTLNTIVLWMEELRTTFKAGDEVDEPLFPDSSGLELPDIPKEISPVLLVPLALDRLRSLVSLMAELLSSPSSRPLPVPVGALITVVCRLLSLTTAEQRQEKNKHTFIDPIRRSMETSIIPSLLEVGCDLCIVSIKRISHHVTPYVPQIASLLVYHLEQDYPKTTRLAFLRAVSVTLSVPFHAHPIGHTPYLPGRFFRALLPSVLRILPNHSGQGVSLPRVTDAPIQVNASKGRRKNKAAAFEGDELLRTGDPQCLNPDTHSWEEALISLDALKPLLLIPTSSSVVRMTSNQSAPSFAHLQSLTLRIMMSLLLSLPYHSHALSIPTHLDRQRLHVILKRVTRICEDVILLDGGTGGDEWLRRALSILIRSSATAATHNRHQLPLASLSLLLHPRVPPHLSLPSTWTSSLSSPRNISDILVFRESKEERGARLGLGIGMASDRALEHQLEKAAATYVDQADRIHPSTTSTASSLQPLQGVMKNLFRPLTTLSNSEAKTASEDPAIRVSNAPRPSSPSVPQSLDAVGSPSTSPIPAASSFSLGGGSLLMEPSKAIVEASSRPPVAHLSNEGIPSKSSMDQGLVLSKTSSINVEIEETMEERPYKYDVPLASGVGVDSDDSEVGPLPEINMGSDED